MYIISSTKLFFLGYQSSVFINTYIDNNPDFSSKNTHAAMIGISIKGHEFSLVNLITISRTRSRLCHFKLASTSNKVSGFGKNSLTLEVCLEKNGL